MGKLEEMENEIVHCVLQPCNYILTSDFYFRKIDEDSER